MKPESGMPAFENIDDLLAEKIVNHGRDHADKTETQAPAEEPDLQAAPVEYAEIGGGVPKKTILIIMIITGLLLLLLYRLFNRQQNRYHRP